MLKKIYLFIYNLISLTGWSYVTFLFFHSLLNFSSPIQLWNTLTPFILYVQMMNIIIEIFHSLFKVVKSPIILVFIQLIVGRLLHIFYLLNFYEKPKNTWCIYVCLGAYIIGELPRYLFYMCKQLPGKVPYIVTWLRYSVFIIVYPIGVFGEMSICFYCFDEMRKTNFSIYCIMWCASSLYIPCWLMLYTSVWKQRNSILGKKKVKTDDDDTPEKKKKKKRKRKTIILLVLYYVLFIIYSVWYHKNLPIK